MLVVAVASGAPLNGPGPIIVPAESAGPLVEPPVISSGNTGVLKADVTLERAGPPGSNDPTLFGGLPLYSDPVEPLRFAAGYAFATPDGKSYPAQFPAPTLKVQPGDTVDLTVRDRLADAPGLTLPPEAAITNVHTHGLVVSPLDEGDNVYRTMTTEGSFRTRVVIPSDHQPGVDWYHAHRHGYVANQVYGGLAGILQIGDPLDPWPQYKGKYTERYLDLTLGLINTDMVTGDRYLANPRAFPGGRLAPYGTTWRKYVNGQFNPTISIRPGETQIWTFSGMNREANFNLGITDANAENPWQATIFSYDGKTTNVMPRKTTLAPPVPFVYDGPTVVDPGARITMAVTAPTKPGTYYLIDNEHQALQPQAQFWALATIEVEGRPATEPPPNLTPNGPVPDLYTAKPDQHRTFEWNFVTAADGSPTFPINGFVFPDSPIVPMQVGQVEEWLLVNTGGGDHVFHIHQNDFAVVRVGSNTIQTGPTSSPYRYTSLRDTVDIPPGQSVVIRFRVSPQLGKYVFHCHILPHEDTGMMMGVFAVPNTSERRIALGSPAGQAAQVIVRDGNGRRLGILHPGGGRRGVSTATGELTSDLDEDIVTAPSTPVAAPSISVYDGKSLERIGRFRPFGNQRVGVSLATGNVDDQGQAEIIAARVGPGASLVRIFKPNGTLVREIRRTLAGPLPNGASVAAADFDGDNYDDVAIGGARGAQPVVVGVSGLALSRGSTSTRLFALTAPGGATAGVNLAAGYYDPVTRPGFVANLITTPASGPAAGRTHVWVPFMPDHEGAPMGAPVRIASFRPLGRHVSRGLRLQVTRLGSNGLDALAAWADPRKAEYISIDDTGTISHIQVPVRNGPPRAGEKGGYKVALDLEGQATATITRKGEPVRGAAVRATFTMLDMAMPPTHSRLHETAPGVYSGRGPTHAMPGHWRVAVRIVPRRGRPETTRLVSVLRPVTR